MSIKTLKLFSDIINKDFCADCRKSALKNPQQDFDNYCESCLEKVKPKLEKLKKELME
jgi:hypothetical protein